MAEIKKKRKSRKYCPLCREENRMYFGRNLWCVVHNQEEIEEYCKWELISNAKKIKLGLIKVGRG